MKWGYLVDEYCVKIVCIVVNCFDISLLFDFIIGFFGEIEDDFNDIFQFIDDIGFDISFSFIYSVCLGILAVDLVDDILMVEKKC